MNDSRSMDGKDANITKKNTYLNESELIKLIKRNLKLKENKEEGAKESETEKEVYRLTINNFIQPSINILSNGQGKEQAKHLSKNKSRREDGKEKKMQL